MTRGFTTEGVSVDVSHLEKMIYGQSDFTVNLGPTGLIGQKYGRNPSLVVSPYETRSIISAQDTRR